MSAILDYGPEIIVGARAVDIHDGRTGVVTAVEGRCHWSCHELAEQWRPRAAYVLRDGARCDDWWPGGQLALGGYVPPERIAVVPVHWTGRGLAAGARPQPRRVRPFCGGRLRAGDGGGWWIMNTDKPSSSGMFYPSIGSLLAGWALKILRFGRDDRGVFAEFEVER